MMMYGIHMSLALSMISLTLGTGLYMWSARTSGPGSAFGKFVGFLVALISLLAVLCSLYCYVLLWRQGMMSCPIGTNQPNMMQGMTGEMDNAGKPMMQHKKHNH